MGYLFLSSLAPECLYEEGGKEEEERGREGMGGKIGEDCGGQGLQ